MLLILRYNIYKYICIHKHVYINTYVYVNIYIYIYIYICTNICIYMCSTGIDIKMYTHLYIYIYMYIQYSRKATLWPTLLSEVYFVKGGEDS